VPQVYSPHRYGYTKFDRFHGYQPRAATWDDHSFRRSLYNNDRGVAFDRGSYYGPAVERYHNNARNWPSYHFDRRESFNRGGDLSPGTRYSGRGQR